MPTSLVLTFEGTLALEGVITARTLAHSLTNLQRAVDKLVFTEERGQLRKFSKLPSELFAHADLIVQPFEPGSIRVPLLSALGNIGEQLREIVEEPFRDINQERVLVLPKLRDQMGNAINRARHRDPDVSNHQNLLVDPEVEREFLKAAVLGDINELVSPVRSRIAGPEDAISLEIRNGQRRRQFVFDREVSEQFAQVVRQKRLGPETAYSGRLAGIEESKYGGFPYSGRFISEATGSELRLLVAQEEAAMALNPFNLTERHLRFWGAPITTYGTFDEIRGDVVFLDFVDERV